VSAANAPAGRVAGKIALVTGAARGIGRATAVALAREGADVIGADIDGPVSSTLEVTPTTADELARTGQDVETAGRRWHAITFDQRDMAAVRRAAEQVRAAFGGLDIVFANAGVQAFKPLLEMQDADWHTQIDVNLTGTANVLRAFAPMLWSAAAVGSSSPPPPRGATAPSSAPPTRLPSGGSSA